MFRHKWGRCTHMYLDDRCLCTNSILCRNSYSSGVSLSVQEPDFTFNCFLMRCPMWFWRTCHLALAWLTGKNNHILSLLALEAMRVCSSISETIQETRNWVILAKFEVKQLLDLIPHGLNCIRSMIILIPFVIQAWSCLNWGAKLLFIKLCRLFIRCFLFCFKHAEDFNKTSRRNLECMCWQNGQQEMGTDMSKKSVMSVATSCTQTSTHGYSHRVDRIEHGVLCGGEHRCVFMLWRTRCGLRVTHQRNTKDGQVSMQVLTIWVPQYIQKVSYEHLKDLWQYNWFRQIDTPKRKKWTECAICASTNAGRRNLAGT